jgi:hypothetical protein
MTNLNGSTISSVRDAFVNLNVSAFNFTIADVAHDIFVPRILWPTDLAYNTMLNRTILLDALDDGNGKCASLVSKIL